jgi:peptide/nickel transport system permease protein
MGSYIFRRLLQGIVVLVLVTFLVFLVLHLMPGDPLMVYVAQNELHNLSSEQLAALKHEFGLDKSFVVQYTDWMGNLFRGNLGTSFILKERVSYIIGQRLPITMHLGIISLVVSGCLGIIFGVICAVRRGTWVDTTVTVLANLGITTPQFWVGILLIYLFAVVLKWLPANGYDSPFGNFWLNTRQIILPIFCLSIGPISIITRQTRSSTLEVIHNDYIRTALSKGLTEKIILTRHALKNSLIPIVTLLGMQVRNIFGGAVLIETVFNIPGMGRLMTEAIYNRDYQIIQGAILIIVLMVVIANLVVDISYGWFDPRIKYA